jgi:uncharacterized membrane protein YfcA
LPLVGFGAGLVGGMFGVGGGLVMIPALLILMDQHFGPESIHVYKLASLLSSVVVSLPAAVKQARAGLIVPRMLPALILFGAAGVPLGTWLASLFQREATRALERLFGLLLIAVALSGLLARRVEGDGALRCTRCPAPSRWGRLGLYVGLPTGFIAGFFGVAGGIWSVPAQNRLLGVRLRYAIANSTASIVVLASAAAATQTAAVASMPTLRAMDGWWLALLLAPGAVAGGWCGAGVSHVVPVRRLRLGFMLVLALAGLRELLKG